MNTDRNTGSEQSDAQNLLSFVESVRGDAGIRVDEELGEGYVRLRSSEAERRQAAQDIRSVEDILIELLRNSRDAGAKNIFIALQRTSDIRTIVILDDGVGIPEALHRLVFEPRVTSKLDSAHMDKWGMHGRGMALFSISVNSRESEVVASRSGLGASIRVVVDLSQICEKSDQSSFPYFENIDGTFAMRGPKNLLRTAAEFALEHRDVNVFIGSFTDIAATMYVYGCSTISLTQRTFKSENDEITFVKRLSFASDPDSFVDIARTLGLDISDRSARRVMEGKIKSLPPLIERIEKESFAKINSLAKRKNTSTNSLKDISLETSNLVSVKLDDEDIALFESALREAYKVISEKYYLNSNAEISIASRNGHISIDIPLRNAQ